MSVKSFDSLGGVNIQIGRYLGGTVNSGAIDPTLYTNKIAVGNVVRDMPTSEVLGPDPSLYAGGGWYNISLKELMSVGLYTKSSIRQYNTMAKTGTNSLNGGMIPGTNGDYMGTCVGRDDRGNWYYVQAHQGQSWRPGANLYRVESDGSYFSRIYSHHHIADLIPDQGTLVVALNDVGSTAGTGHFAFITRWQNTGEPVAGITTWNGPGASIYGSNNVPFSVLAGVNAWGMPLDAINIPNTDPNYTTGVMLWQRQWWGPRLVFFKRNGGTGIQNQTQQALDVYYQTWIWDHNFCGQGGVAFSPNSSRIYAIFTYEPQDQGGNGQDAGINLAINHLTVGNINGSGAITTSGLATSILHFIWDSPNGPFFGFFRGAHICYLGVAPNGQDQLAYAFTRANDNDIHIRFVTYDPNGQDYYRYAVSSEDSMGGVNTYQRIRITRMGVSRVHNEVGQLDATYYNVALSYVDDGNNTRIKTYRVRASDLQIMSSQQDYQPTGNYRGILATNTTPYSTDQEPQHAVVLGTNNTGLQNTYVWASGKPYNTGVDHDNARMLRFI